MRIGRNVSSTCFLILGYILGQGSAFLLLVSLRDTAHPETAGASVLYLSLFSLCFQFADFGNATYASRQYASDQNKYKTYLGSRAMIAVPAVFLTTIFCMPPDLSNEIKWKLLILLPIGAAAFGMSELAAIESKGRYRLFALLQAGPWIVTSIILWATLGLSLLTIDAAMFLWIIIPIGYLYFSKTRITEICSAAINATFRQRLTPISFLVPTLLGQIWGREMLIIAASTSGIASMASLGILRNVHTAGCLAIAFALRPILRQKLEKSTSNKEKAFVLSHKIIALFIVLAIILSIYSIKPIGLPKDIAGWLPILIGVPLWGIGMVVTSENQIRYPPKFFSIVEVLSMGVHAVAFLATIGLSVPWAFVLADLFRLLPLYFSRRIKSGQVS